MVGLKVMAILTGYSSLADQTSTSLSSDYIEIPRKTASRNSFKFKRDPMVGLKIMAILTRYSSLANETSSSPSNDSIATLRKTVSRNVCKTLSAM
jgi:hypothetical protein